MRVIGIDPGSVITGTGVVEFIDKKCKVIDYDALKMNSRIPMPKRLKLVYDFCSEKIKKYKPDYLALETAFFGKNIQSTLKLGQVRGAVIVSSLNEDVEVFEYSPREIKKSVTGNGSSSKQVVQTYIKSILSMKVSSILSDSSDALAIALCHYYSMGNNITYKTGKNKTNWKDFIERNPHKIYRRRI